MRRAPVIVSLLALLSVRGAAADDPADAAKRAKLDAAKQAFDDERRAFGTKVNAAIDRGVAWLKARQKSTGAFPAYGDKLPPNTYSPMDLGVNALAMLTLAKSGVPADDKAMEKAKTYCLAEYAKMKGLKKVLVYPASVLLLAFEAMYHPEAKDETDVRKDRYGTTVVRKKTPCKYPAAIDALVDELARFLVKVQTTKVGGWRYPGIEDGAPAGDAEMSNTQYALLGLNAAARCGSTVPLEVWNKALAYVLAEQEKDGLDGELVLENPDWQPGADEVPRWRSGGKRKCRGWRYTPDGPQTLTTGSMTTAGLASLAIVKERLTDAGKLTPDVARKIDAAMLDGFVWLSEVFTVADNPTFPAGGAPWHLYYLYGLERVCALTGFANVGKHDWYREGAELLLGAQKPDGHWEGQVGTMKLTDEHESPVVQTCFALLFLKRSTVPPVVPITPKVTTGDDAAPPADGRGR